MPRKKQTAKPTPKKVTEPEVTEPETVTRYKSIRLHMCQPGSEVYFVPGIPVEATGDGWLKSQIEAGTIKKC